MTRTGRILETTTLFLRHLTDGLKAIWPVFTGILLIVILFGLLIGWLESWAMADGVYFAFITALTIGYGDFVPTTTLARFLSVILGIFGFLLTGILAAMAVRALRATMDLGD